MLDDLNMSWKNVQTQIYYSLHKKIVSVFEESVYIGAKTIWSEIQAFGYRFHLTQNWWKLIQSLGKYIFEYTYNYIIVILK
jgi:hypothetical protein